MRRFSVHLESVAVIAAVVIAGCADADGPGESDPSATRSQLGVPDAVIVARRSEVAAFLADRSRGWAIVDTRQTPSSATVDYVRAETLYPQSPGAPFAQPPPLPVKTRLAGIEEGRTEFHDEPLRAPAGTIPVLRPNFDRYLSGDSKARSISEFLAEIPTPAPSYVNNRLYGSHHDSRANIGTSGSVNLWNYQEVGTGEMSLLQSASLCYGASPNTDLEAIEVGFQKMPFSGLYSDANVHFFTFFRTAGGSTGNLVGGYNLTVTGFIQAAGAPFPPGAAMSSTSYSVIDGQQIECTIMTQLDHGNWWVYGCGSWLGYYPTTSSTSVAAAQRINFDLIGNAACATDWYGETYDPTPTTWTNADMGSGMFPASGYGRAAYIREPFILFSASSDWFSSSVPGAGPGYDPDCYQVSNIFQNGGSGWTRWFYVGGPGGNNPGCN